MAKVNKLKHLIKHQNGKCIYCKRIMNSVWVKLKLPEEELVIIRLAYQQNPLSPTIEHLHPTASGGVNDMTNFAASCNQCNSIKGSTHHNMFKYTVFDENSLHARQYRVSQASLINQGYRNLTRHIEFRFRQLKRKIKEC